MAACANARDERQDDELLLVFIVACRPVHPDMVIYWGTFMHVHLCIIVLLWKWKKAHIFSPSTDLMMLSTSISIQSLTQAYLSGQNISWRHAGFELTGHYIEIVPNKWPHGEAVQMHRNHVMPVKLVQLFHLSIEAHSDALLHHLPPSRDKIQWKLCKRTGPIKWSNFSQIINN